VSGTRERGWKKGRRTDVAWSEVLVGGGEHALAKEIAKMTENNKESV
jgi:hypothetical protein